MRNVRELIAQTLPPWPSLWRCALTGVLGIASGFAVFLLWLDEISRGPVRFVVALGVAVVVAFVFESLKEDLEGHGHRWQAPRLLVLVVLLTMAELFVMGYHAAVSLTKEQFHETLETLLGGDVARWHALGVVGIWLVLGGAIAVGLGATIFKVGCEIPEDEPLSWSKPAVWGLPMLRSALRGGLTGALAGPLCMLIYIFVVRFVSEYVWILGAPEKWRQHLKGAAQAVSSSGGWGWLIWLPIQAIEQIDRVFAVFGRSGPFLTLAALVAILVVCARLRAVRTFVVILAGVVVVYVYPVLAQSAGTLLLACLMAYVWAIPGVLLGALTPWLKRPAGYPKLWGVVAFGAAGIMAIGTFAIHWFIIPAILFGIVGLLFRRGVQVEQYWAVLALSVATNVFGATHLFARADFFNIQRDSFELTRAPLQAFAYRAFQLDPRLEDAIRRSLSAPSLLQSPSLTPGPGVPLFPPPLPWALAASPEIQLAADLEALRAERAETAEAAAGFAARLGELATMATDLAEKRDSLDEKPKAKDGSETTAYPAYHKKWQDLAAWASGAIARRQSLAAEAAAALDTEGKRSSAAATTLSSIARLRDEQLGLQSVRQQLLATIREVKDRGDGLRAPLDAFQNVVTRRATDLHNTALRAFEVALTASSGFWITLGLLASWSIRRQGTPP